MVLEEGNTFVNADQPRVRPENQTDAAADAVRAEAHAKANDPTILNVPGNPDSPYDHSEPKRVPVQDEKVVDAPPESPLAPKTADPEHHEPPAPGHPELDDEPAQPAKKFVP